MFSPTRLSWLRHYRAGINPWGRYPIIIYIMYLYHLYPAI